VLIGPKIGKGEDRGKNVGLGQKRKKGHGLRTKHSKAKQYRRETQVTGGGKGVAPCAGGRGNKGRKKAAYGQPRRKRNRLQKKYKNEGQKRGKKRTQPQESFQNRKREGEEKRAQVGVGTEIETQCRELPTKKGMGLEQTGEEK